MNVNWKEVIHIAAAGAFGGGVSIIYSTTTGTPPVIAPIPFGIVAYAVLGSVSALIGVYVLAKTDTSHAIHCLVFAIVCGVFWAPIFDGASALVQRNRERALNAQVQEQIEAVQDSVAKLKAAPPEQLAPTATLAVERVEGLFSSAAQVRDPRLSLEVRANVSELVESLRDVSDKDPALTSNAIRRIRRAQATAGFNNLYFSLPDDAKAFAYERKPEGAEVEKPSGG